MGLDYLIRGLGGIASVAVLAAIKCRLYLHIGIMEEASFVTRQDGYKDGAMGLGFKETTIKHISNCLPCIPTINSDMKSFVNTLFLTLQS